MKDLIARESALFIAILVAAAALRLWGVNQELWYDEIETLTAFVRRPVHDMIFVFGSLNNHLAFTWLAKLSTTLFGESPWSMRLPAALMGIASIWAVWRLARFTGLKWVALTTAALLALSYHHVWFSQNARGYTGLLLFTTLSGLFMAYGLTRKRMSDWVFYALFAAAALVTHLTAAFLLTAQGVTALAIGYRSVFIKRETTVWAWLKGPLVGFGGAIALTLLVFAPMLPDIFATFGAYDAPTESKTGTGVEEWHSPLWTVFETVRSFGAMGALLPIAFLFAAIGAYRLAKISPLIAAPFLIHIPLTLLILLAASFRIWPRYFFIDIGFLIACVVYGAFWFADLAERILPQIKRVGLNSETLKIFGTALMIIASIPLLAKNYMGPKQEFEPAVAYVERARQPEDTIVTVGLAELPFGEYLTPDWPHMKSFGELDTAIDEADAGVWVVIVFPKHTSTTYPDIAQRLSDEFELVEEFSGTLSGGEVQVYRRLAP